MIRGFASMLIAAFLMRCEFALFASVNGGPEVFVTQETAYLFVVLFGVVWLCLHGILWGKPQEAS